MSESLDEQLSAMLDGELPPEESGLLLKRLERDGELGATFGRYALVGESLRGARGVGTTRALFIARVHAAIAEAAPETVPEQSEPRSRPWRRTLTGLAVAATVAGATVLVLSRAPEGPGTAAPATLAAAPSVAASVAAGEPAVSNRPAAGSYVTPPKTKPSLIPPDELANYVVAHSDFASALPPNGAMLTGLMAEESSADAPLLGPAPPVGDARP